MRSGVPMSREEAARLLGLRPAADPGAVRHAWRMWARVAHPDVGGDPEHFARLDHARRVMMQPLAPVAKPEWRPQPRQPLGAVLTAPSRPIGLILAAMLTLLLGTLPGSVPGPISPGMLVVMAVPASALAALTAVWAARQVLTADADRGHRIMVLAGVWLPLAVLLVVVSTLTGASMLPVLPVLALPLVAAVAALDPGAGLWRPIGLGGQQ